MEQEIGRSPSKQPTIGALSGRRAPPVPRAATTEFEAIRKPTWRKLTSTEC
jgi:hypothetical protein